MQCTLINSRAGQKKGRSREGKRRIAANKAGEAKKAQKSGRKEE
jgi:hypothetical protein